MGVELPGYAFDSPKVSITSFAASKKFAGGKFLGKNEPKTRYDGALQTSPPQESSIEFDESAIGEIRGFPSNFRSGGEWFLVK